MHVALWDSWLVLSAAVIAGLLMFGVVRSSSQALRASEDHDAWLHARELHRAHEHELDVRKDALGQVVTARRYRRD
ncbi:hypothetical protein [Nocardioides bruguierae]|uniref:Uncharacterized protein n=1 Tax=Nocardioides bruguierae TaxID=2945102 RepID=A0A9X2IGF2_9ACTN|nr:hypothetical protein [Nocardioides bruguierae]MCL8027164.1 hypothetical protein [Nocardioides bruguierae]MCM0622312.1 hypothetical protein [Nocardioides bruguierae]